MKKFTAALVLFVLLFSSGVAFSAAVPLSAPRPVASVPTRTSAPSAVLLPRQEDSFYDVWIRDRLSIGIGFSVSTLTKNHRPQDRDAHRTFVGYVNKLEDERPVRFTADVSYWTARHLMLGLSFDRVGGQTRNYNNHRSDGCLELWGPVLYADVVFPCLNDTLFPHFGAGIVYGVADFEEEKWWHLGYSNPEEYAAAGRSDKTKNNRYREIRVDDGFGLILQGGIAWRPVEHVQFGLTLRQTFLSCDAEFGYRGNHGFHREMSGDFDLDNFSAVVTVAYVF